MRKLAVGLGLMAVTAFGISWMPQDGGKSLVEQPYKKEIIPTGKEEQPPEPIGKVSTGQINWHPSFAKAIEAAKASGKPVLLFQLLGQLDEEFC